MNLQVIRKEKILGKSFELYGTFENPLFLAKDIAKWIEHKQVSRMIEMVDEDEKLICQIGTSGQTREAWFLTEDGLYEVLFQSRKPIAKAFKREVKKLLKSLRKGEIKILQQKSTTEWQQARALGKPYRKVFTDSIQAYVSYCEENGSKNAKRYYTTFTTMINKAVGCESRDTANASQLAQLAFIEDFVQRMIYFHMSQNTEYHEIFYMCKVQVQNIINSTKLLT